jgi:uncharacterized membrane protein
MEEQKVTPQAAATDVAKITESQHKTLMGVLCYLGILIIVPYLMAKDDSFVKFHLKQGLVLVVIELVLWVAGMVLMHQMFAVLGIVQLAVIGLSIFGIVNVVQNKETELPVVGQFSSHFDTI